MCKSCKVNDRIHAIDVTTPIDILGQITHWMDFNCLSQVYNTPGGCAYKIPVTNQARDQVPSEKAGGTRDKNMLSHVHRLPPSGQPRWITISVYPCANCTRGLY